jgi:hypothetical protein
MSVEILRLDCLLDTSVERAAKAVDANLRKGGWRPTDDARSAAREIRIASRKRLVVVDEVDARGMPVAWGEMITRELGCEAVAMQAEPDVGSFVIERWSAGALKGRASVSEGSGGVVKLPFLSAFVDDAKRRGQLTRGIRVAPSEATDVFLGIAKDAGLPRPLSRQETLAGARILRFLPPLEAPNARTVTVGFERSFHVRDVDPAILLTALRKRRPRSRQMFVIPTARWVSFGEVLGDDAAEEGWGKVLSKELGLDVLEVKAFGSKAAELSVWHAGQRKGRISLPNEFVRTNKADPTRISVSTAALRPFGPKRESVRLGKEEFALAVWSGAVRAILVALAETVDLPRPVIEGRLVGTVITFDAKGAAR